MTSPAAAKAARRRAALKKNTPSTIDRLDPEIRDLIAQLRIDKGLTINEIRDALVKVIGEERAPSRSALGRHVRSLAEVSAMIGETEIYAAAFAKEAGSKKGEQLLEMNTQLLQAHLFRLLVAAKDGESVTLSAIEVKHASDALNNFAKTRASSLTTPSTTSRRSNCAPATG